MEHPSSPTTAARAHRLPFDHRGLLLIGLTLLAGGAALDWGWLTAIGVAPIILAVAPCALMCAAGLCMAGGSKSCAAKSAPAVERESERD